MASEQLAELALLVPLVPLEPWEAQQQLCVFQVRVIGERPKAVLDLELAQAKHSEEAPTVL